jgi:anti-sigma B factor antagonist
MTSTSTALDGEWTIHHAAQCHSVLLTHIEAGTSDFDVSGVTDFDSAGLQLLLAARISLASQGCELALNGVPTVVRDVLDAYGLDLTLNSVAHEVSP